MAILCERCRREVEAESGIPAPPPIIDLQVALLPAVSVFDYALLPASSAVYFAFTERGICYIGKAANLCARWSGHSHFTRLAKADGRIAWLSIPDAKIRDAYEKQAIEFFKPLWNKGGDEYLDPITVSIRFPNIAGGKITRSMELKQTSTAGQG